MYKLAALAVVLSAIMHFVAFVLGQFKADVLPLAIFGAVYLMFAILLYRERRRTAWLSFFVMLIGMSAALTFINSGTAAPDWVFVAISILNVVSAVFLFFVLWKSKGQGSTSVAGGPRL